MNRQTHESNADSRNTISWNQVRSFFILEASMFAVGLGLGGVVYEGVKNCSDAAQRAYAHNEAAYFQPDNIAYTLEPTSACIQATFNTNGGSRQRLLRRLGGGLSAQLESGLFSVDGTRIATGADRDSLHGVAQGLNLCVAQPNSCVVAPMGQVVVHP